jgi:hypothetical protein
MGVERAGSEEELGFVRDRKTILAHKLLLDMELDEIADPSAVQDNPEFVGMLTALEWVLGERGVLISGDRVIESTARLISSVRIEESKRL